MLVVKVISKSEEFSKFFQVTFTHYHVLKEFINDSYVPNVKSKKKKKNG